MSTLSRKARADLRRHPVRIVLVVLTLGLAIGSFGVVAVPRLLDTSLQSQVAEARLYDVAVLTRDLTLTPAQLQTLGHLPNIAGFDAAIEYSTVASSPGLGSQAALLWGLDWPDQPVDAVRLASGRPPANGAAEVLSDEGNGNAAGFPVETGHEVALRTTAGSTAPLVVSGVGLSLATNSTATGSDAAVFYTSLQTARRLSGVKGFNYLAFRLTHDTIPAQTAAIDEVRRYLTAATGASPFVALPTTRAPGSFPGQTAFDQLVALFLVITVLALLCALFLISNTMNTLALEQGPEIAILKTLGGRRRQIAGVVLRTAAYLGVAGAIVGAGIGILGAYGLTSYLARSLLNVPAGFAVSIPVIVVSLVAGPLLAVLTSLPGLRRGLRRPVIELLGDRGTVEYGSGRLDRALARAQLLSGSARVGLRNVLRSKRRSAATIAQIALAVGLTIALLGVGRTVASATSAVFGAFHFQIEMDANAGSPSFNARASAVAASTPGVTSVEPVAESDVELDGTEYPALGLGEHTDFAYRLSAGRWFGSGDNGALPPPVVLGPAVARRVGAHVGQILTVRVPAGSTHVRVIGIDTVNFDTGTNVYFPLAQLQRLTNSPREADAMWLTTRSSAHSDINQVAADVQARLGRAGFPAAIQKEYVNAAQNVSSNNSIVEIVEVLGLLVVGITLIGLVSTLTMAVIERTREVGVLRCLGANARQVRRLFSTEAMAMAVAGWLIGCGVGWLLYIGLVMFIEHDFNVTTPLQFPPLSLPASLLLIVAVTIVVIRPPLRRATRIRPSTALRYE